MASPVKAAPSTVAATWAAVDGAGGGTAGAQPAIWPASVAKRNRAGPLALPELTTKSLVPLNTCPVGPSLGIATTSGVTVRAVPLGPPPYRVATSVPLSATQKFDIGLRASPQGLTRFGSVRMAWPAWSATRLVWR